MVVSDDERYLFSLYGCEAASDNDAARREEEVEAVSVKK